MGGFLQENIRKRKKGRKIVVIISPIQRLSQNTVIVLDMDNLNKFF